MDASWTPQEELLSSDVYSGKPLPFRVAVDWAWAAACDGGTWVGLAGMPVCSGLGVLNVESSLIRSKAIKSMLIQLT